MDWWYDRSDDYSVWVKGREQWDGFPPEFTKEEVQKVLDGEKTFAQIIEEKSQNTRV